LVKWKQRAGAFSGEGSRLYGGRWASPGHRAVYVSDTQALSALENIVHFQPGQTPPAYAFLSVEFDSALVQTLGVTLPPNWATMPAVTAAIGDAWLTDPKSSCILALPSALVPEGTNYLINPTHADFGKLTVGAAIPFAFDLRIAPPPALPTSKTL
jgi:RES domain-containing protein